MVGADLAARFRAAGLEASGQRRNVTVIFVDLSGFTTLSEHMDAEELYHLVQNFLRRMGECVYKYDGFVDKFLGDGLMALFGAPIAQENNAELAIRAVLDMQASLAEYNQELQARYGLTIRMHAGVHSGSVIVGGIGSDMMMDYTAIGNTVNLASRLQQAAAPGTILVSEHTYRQTKAFFRFLKLAPIQVRGISKPIMPYQVLGERAKPGSARGLDGIVNPMVGRQEELNVLLNAIQALYEKRKGGLVIIRGHGGMGKSRLMREARAHLPAEKVRVLEGQSLTYRRNVAYWLFRDLLRNLIAAPQNAPDEWLRTTFRQHGEAILGPRYPEQRSYLEYILGLPPDNENDKQRLTQMDAEQLQQRIFIAVRDFLLFLARQKPLLLVLEDLHWADEISLKLITYLLGALRETSILIIGITRPMDSSLLENLLSQAEKTLKSGFKLLEVSTLDQEHSEILLGTLVNLSNLPASFRVQVLQRAAGIPFYLEEIVRMLLDRGILQRQGNVLLVGDLPPGDLSQLGIPESLEGLILTRFDQLPPKERLFLQVASAIGRQFNLHLVEEVLDAKSSLDDSAALLTRHEFIVPIAEAPAEYEFRHELVSDAIYSSILRSDRQKLHGKIGASIEKLYAGQLSQHIEVLARHYAWSDRPDRALHYLLLAGQRALKNYANEQARQQFSQAIPLLNQVKASMRQYVQAYTGMGDVLLFTGQYDEARMHYQQALQHLQSEPQAIRPLVLSTLQRKVATTYERQGAYDQAIALLQQAEHTLNTTSELRPVERAQVMEDVGWIHFRRGDLDDAENHLLRALELVQNSNAYGVVASIYNRLGGVYFQKDDLEKALTYVTHSLELREKIGDLVALARSYNNLGLLHWKAGKWPEALAAFQRSLRLNETLGDVEAIALINNNIGLLYTDQGHTKLALEHINTALDITKNIGHVHLEGQGYLHRSRLHLTMQNWGQAIEDSNKGLQIFKRIGSQEHLIDLYLTQAEAHLGLSDLAMAEDMLKAAFQTLQHDLTKAMSPSSERGRALRLAANLAIQHMQWERAAQLITESLETLQAAGNQLEYARTLTTLAELHKKQNRPEEAVDAASQAALIFKELGAQPDLARLAQIKVLDVSRLN
ncbi:MAG: adenylate/guanylate cyclase domain-containing protein [Anaerolineales bacterium]